MSAHTKCGVDCELCDCGRTENICKWQISKKKLRSKRPVVTKTVTKKKESKSDKKKRRKKGRR
jgi:hypothetical protein